MKLLRTGDIARKAGVTVRTLRYYDQVGLLKPSGYSESGQRLYSGSDMARLQQILTLKLIGLSLEEIKGLLTTNIDDMEQLLARQKRVLQAQMSQLAAIIQTIEQAQAAIHTSHTLDLEQFIDIIRAVNMSQQTNWYEQFFTDGQRERLEESHRRETLDMQRQDGELWKRLFEDAQVLIGRDVHDPDVQSLVERWDALIEQSAQGDTALAERLNAAYASVAILAAQGHENSGSGKSLPYENEGDLSWAEGLQTAAQFIQQARDVRGG